VRRNPPRSLLRAIAPLIVAGTSLIAATAAAGIEPAIPTPLADSAFAPVTVPSASAGVPAAPVASAAAPSEALVVDAATLAELHAGVLADLSNGRPDRARPRVREPKPIVVEVEPPPKPEPATSHVLSGPASWYCRAGVSPCTSTHPDGGGFDAYAAAGPKLRAAIGPGWRGRIVLVDGVRVKLIDWCQCFKGERQEKLLDLYYDVY
jgi:hypothetical protein